MAIHIPKNQYSACFIMEGGNNSLSNVMVMLVMLLSTVILHIQCPQENGQRNDSGMKNIHICIEFIRTHTTEL